MLETQTPLNLIDRSIMRYWQVLILIEQICRIDCACACASANTFIRNKMLWFHLTILLLLLHYRAAACLSLSFAVFSFARPTGRPPLSISVPSAVLSIRRHPSTLCRLRAQWAVNRFYPLKFTQLRKSWCFLLTPCTPYVFLLHLAPLLNGAGRGRVTAWASIPFTIFYCTISSAFSPLCARSFSNAYLNTLSFSLCLSLLFFWFLFFVICEWKHQMRIYTPIFGGLFFAFPSCDSPACGEKVFLHSVLLHYNTRTHTHTHTRIHNTHGWRLVCFFLLFPHTAPAHTYNKTVSSVHFFPFSSMFWRYCTIQWQQRTSENSMRRLVGHTALTTWLSHSVPIKFFFAVKKNNRHEHNTRYSLSSSVRSFLFFVRSCSNVFLKKKKRKIKRKTEEKHLLNWKPATKMAWFSLHRIYPSRAIANLSC